MKSILKLQKTLVYIFMILLIQKIENKLMFSGVETTTVTVENMTCIAKDK